MPFKVRALYDFIAEPNTGELAIYENEILTVKRTDVGVGWWEGTNSVGQTGIFPENYVEVISVNSSPPNVLPPVPLKSIFGFQQNDSGDETSEYSSPFEEESWNRDTWNEIHPNSAEGSQQEVLQQPLLISSDSSAGNCGSFGAVSKINLSRFSSFSKAGGDNYLLGQVNVSVHDYEKFEIHCVDDVYYWMPSTESYSVVVSSPKKESKFKGFKSYMTYQLTPSFNSIKIFRRYKHFDWLHERLTEKYCLIPLPNLPDKQITGRYDEHFIEQRCSQLQEFVDWICRHPILSRSKVWKHFLTCTDERIWKIGKREAENDKVVGLNFCLSIKAPLIPLQASVIDIQTEGFLNYATQMDTVVRTLAANCAVQARKYRTMYNNEYQILGASFQAFGSAVALDEGAELATIQLAAISKELGSAYIDIGKYFEEQPIKDWNPLFYKLHVHRGIFAAMPNILNIHKETRSKKKEFDKMVSENKMDISQMDGIKRRIDLTSYAVLAEISYVRAEREAQLKVILNNHLKEQITFYKCIVARLVAASNKINEISS